MGKNMQFASFFNTDPQQDISASRSNLGNSINNHNNHDDDDVYNTKKSYSLVHTRTKSTSNNNSNSYSNSNNKHVKVINARINEIDQSNPKGDNDTTKSVNNNNNNDGDDIYNTKQSSSLVNTRNNFNSNINSNSNSNYKNIKVIDARIKEIDQSNLKVDNNTGQV